MDSDTFGVYCAGETLEGTDISVCFVELVTVLGKVRMTSEEAESTGRALIAAAEFNRRPDGE